MKNFQFFKRANTFISSVNPNLRFLFILLLFAIFYGYPAILVKRPQSVHHYRQSDCASIALMYYQTGMHFFQPQTHNLTSGGKATGYSAPSEIPIEYYFIAILYKIFGYHDYIFRFVNTLIFLLGLYYLFRTCLLLFKDFFWSAAITLFFFTSPVLVYYGNNFLTDSSAFAFALIGWYFFFKFYLDKKQSDFYISMFFMFLAGANKISGLLSLVAIFAVFFIELIRLIRLRKEYKIFERPILTVLPIVLIFLIIVSWVIFATNFNFIHGSAYFSTWIIPIWDMDKQQIQWVVNQIQGLWINQYFHPAAFYFLAAAFLFSMVFMKKANRLIMIITLLLLIGVVIYAILWFATFGAHDYYTINLYIFLVFIMINFLWVFKNRFPKIFSSYYLKMLFLCFLLFNMNHARISLVERYTGWWTEYPQYKDYHIVTPYLRSIGIAPLDTVVCLPDESHFTLYLMNQRGWTKWGGNNSKMVTSINYGAKYLIINGEETLNQEYLQSFMKSPIGQFNTIKIFKLGKSSTLPPLNSTLNH
jgi:hypothetical protein